MLAVLASSALAAQSAASVSLACKMKPGVAFRHRVLGIEINAWLALSLVLSTP